MKSRNLTDPADWRTALTEAVNIVAGPERPADQATWVPLGQAHPTGDGNWFTMHPRSFKPSPTARLCFAPAQGFKGDKDPAATVYSVSGFYEDPRGWHFEGSRCVPPTHRHIYYRKEGKGAIFHSIRELAASVRESPLADALAKGLLQPIPDIDAKAVPEGLTTHQFKAYQSCLAPGVRVVWGPPGSGKSRVLAKAMATLIDQGKRVLLVSNANVAVDNALIKLATDSSYEAGVVVRAGQAQLPELRENRELLLSTLARDQTHAAQGEVDSLHERLSQLQQRDTAALEPLRQILAEFDHDEVTAAELAVKHQKTRLALSERLVRARTEFGAAESKVSEAVQKLSELEQHKMATAEARRHIASATTLRHHADDLAAELDDQRAELDRLELRASNASWLARVGHRWQIRQVRRRYRAIEPRVNQDITQWWAAAAAEENLAAPYDEMFFVHLDQQIAATSRRLARDRRFAKTLESTVRTTEATLRAVNYPSPSEEQLKILERATACGYKERRLNLQRLECEEAQARSWQSEVETKLAEALTALEGFRKDAEEKVLGNARVVATTLAYARMRSVIKRSRFDAVLIDEVGTASVGDALCALALGTETAVLFGDFLQLRPVFPVPSHKKKGLSSTDVDFAELWLGTSPLERLGIQSPAHAMESPGCVTLLHQFRFGSRLRELANDLVYEVLADGDSLPGMPKNPKTDIIVIDTADLGGHEEVVRPQGRSAGWTSGGMMLSRALAATHLERGQSVGVIAPYNYQVEATRAGLQDTPNLESVPVGTVHSFQGTEYDVAVFDLVEDGTGWMAKTSRDPSNSWGHEGLRLAAVAATRARQRLYCLLNLEATRPSSPGDTLMHILHDGVASGRFETWSAAELLGLTPQRAVAEGSVFGAVQRELGKTVGVEAVFDEHTFHPALFDELHKAKHSVWMWAPWVASRFVHVEPHLKAAADRGVDITIFMRTDESHGQPRSRQYVERALDLDARIIRVDNEHRKVVIVDGHTIMMGSLNANSGTVRTREVMVLYRGRAYAQRILGALDAEKQAKPPACKTCGVKRILWRSTSSKAPVYRWCCLTCDSSKKHRLRL